MLTRNSRLAFSMALAVALLIITLVAACAPGQPTPAPAPKPAASPAPAPAPATTPSPTPKPYTWPKGYSIGTPGVTSAAYAAIAAWTGELEKATGVKARLVPEDNTQLQATWLARGEIDMMDQNETSMADIIAAINWRPEFQTRDGGPFEIRRVGLRQPTWFTFFVAADTGIKTYKDIKPGLRLSQFTNNPHWVRAIIKLVGLKESDFKIIPFSAYASSVNAVKEGKADLAVVAPAASTAFEAEASTRGAVFLNLPTEAEDPVGVKAFRTEWAAPFGKVLSGVKGAIGINTVQLPGGLWGTDKLDADFAYNLLKWQSENYDKFKDKTSETPYITLDFFRQYLDLAMIPTHPGSIRYMKEIGKWTPADDDRQKFNEWRLKRYIEAYKAAIADADSKKIDVDPKNAAWLALWKKYVDEVYKLPPFIPLNNNDIKAELARIK